MGKRGSVPGRGRPLSASGRATGAPPSGGEGAWTFLTDACEGTGAVTLDVNGALISSYGDSAYTWDPSGTTLAMRPLACPRRKGTSPPPTPCRCRRSLTRPPPARSPTQPTTPSATPTPPGTRFPSAHRKPTPTTKPTRRTPMSMSGRSKGSARPPPGPPPPAPTTTPRSSSRRSSTPSRNPNPSPSPLTNPATSPPTPSSAKAA